MVAKNCVMSSFQSQNMKQRTWLLDKVGALSRSVIFDGDPRHTDFYWAHCQIARSSGELGKSQPKKIVRDKVQGPIQNYNF